MNSILRTDSYKMGQFKQYPPKTQVVYSYGESRGGLYPQTTFFGLQYILKKYLAGKQFEHHDIRKAKVFAKEHFGRDDCFNYDGWSDMYEKYGGRFPVRIKAVPEGTTVPTGNVLFTIENTDEEFPWITNYLETTLMRVWYPTTVCTTSREIRKTLLHYYKLTGSVLSAIDFSHHDFGSRGVSSEESAAIGAAAHLVISKGTDTIAGIEMLYDYYGAKAMPGFSIPAMEHSTVTSWGKEGEAAAFNNMLDRYPMGIIAIVVDSYDLKNAVTNLLGKHLREKILAREGTVVVRPDSGDPVHNVLNCLYWLTQNFGSTQNSAGYHVLSPKVRVIQGDGIDHEMIKEILREMDDYGFAAENVAFGMGGALLQKLDRDTQKFAIKCSEVTVDGVHRDVFKEAPGKSSKRGRLALSRDTEGGFHTMGETCPAPNMLKTVFENGTVYDEGNSFEEIRERAAV